MVMTRKYVIAGVCLLMAAACGAERTQLAPSQEAPGSNGARSNGGDTGDLFTAQPQISIVNGDQAATIDISLPDNIDNLPGPLADEIRKRANRGTEAFIATAQADKAAAANEGFEFREHSLDVSWVEVGPKSGRLAGFLGTYATYTGGAHPNVGFDVLNWDREESRVLAFEDLFKDSVNARQLMADALKKGLLEAKRARLEGTGFDETEMMSAWVSPAFEDNNAVFQGFTIARSDDESLAGGLVYHFAPYEVGAYAEGVYKVGVPYTDFADQLKGSYAEAFGGDPILP